MENLIQKTGTSLIICENLKCNYQTPYLDTNYEGLSKYVDMPCPKCGEILLTNDDILRIKKVDKLIKWINKWFSWITFFHSTKSSENTKTFSLHYFDGVKIKDETNNENKS